LLPLFGYAPATMLRSSRLVKLVLITTGLLAMGFFISDCDRDDYAGTTQPTGSRHRTSHWFGHSWSSGSGRSSSGSSSFSSHTSRGGFGSTGHSVGS
jgi:hypothetical protein